MKLNLYFILVIAVNGFNRLQLFRKYHKSCVAVAEKETNNCRHQKGSVRNYKREMIRKQTVKQIYASFLI